MAGLFWAKSGKGSWLSLLAHALDTAAVACEILRRESGTLVGILSRALGLPSERIISFVSALCGLHDLGKASPVFQAKWEEGKRRLEKQGFPFPSARFLKDGPHHGAFSQVFLEELFLKYDFPENVARELALILAAHHGFPPGFSDLARIRRSPRLKGTGLWEKARRKLFETIFCILGAEDLRPRKISPEGAALLMGLTTVTDWVASNEDLFPYGRRTEDPKAFFEEASRIAREALDRLGWKTGSLTGEVPAFEEIFGFAPNSLQKTVAEIVREFNESGFF